MKYCIFLYGFSKKKNSSPAIIKISLDIQKKKQLRNSTSKNKEASAIADEAQNCIEKGEFQNNIDDKHDTTMMMIVMTTYAFSF